MTNERELLERAAKAAGIALLDWLDTWADNGGGKYGAAWRTTERELWNPLRFDDDALRLAVALHLQITPYPVYDMPKHSVVVGPRCWDTDGARDRTQDVIEPFMPQGAEAATRLAIVRAAAEIGRG